jgi:CheY-like chemotaxis protein
MPMARILLVDDYIPNQFTIRTMLEEGGFQVSTETNGRDALRSLEATSFDLIISDISMPVMDGISFVRQLRLQAHTCHIPVIMLTASSDPADYTITKRIGIQGFLTKPVTDEELLAAVQRALANAGQTQATALDNSHL